MKKLQPPKVSKAILSVLRKLSIADQKSAWRNNSVAADLFKKAVTAQLLAQSRRCAYCGVRFVGDYHHRDHVAPKAANLYPEWIFQPRNIVLACATCNSHYKKQYDPITAKSAVYKKAVFRIVHPYLDDPADHLEFIGHRLRVLIRARNNSEKGSNTITLFDLSSAERSKDRIKDALIDKEVDHLHGKWRILADNFLLSAFPLHIALKIPRRY